MITFGIVKDKQIIATPLKIESETQAIDSRNIFLTIQESIDTISLKEILNEICKCLLIYIKLLIININTAIDNPIAKPIIFNFKIIPKIKDNKVAILNKKKTDHKATKVLSFLIINIEVVNNGNKKINGIVHQIKSSPYLNISCVLGRLLEKYIYVNDERIYAIIKINPKKMDNQMDETIIFC